MTTDRILPPVNLGRGGGHHGPAATPITAARHGADVAPIVQLASPTQRDASVRDRVGARALRGSARRTGIAKAAALAKPRGNSLHSTATRAGALVGVSAVIYAVSLAAVAGLEAQSQAQAAAEAQPQLDALASTTAANDAMDAAIQDASARLRQLAHDYDSMSADVSVYQARFDQLSSLVAKIQGSAAAMNGNFKLPTVTMRGAISSGGGGSVVVTTTGGSGKP